MRSLLVCSKQHCSRDIKSARGVVDVSRKSVGEERMRGGKLRGYGYSQNQDVVRVGKIRIFSEGT